MFEHWNDSHKQGAHRVDPQTGRTPGEKQDVAKASLHLQDSLAHGATSSGDRREDSARLQESTQRSTFEQSEQLERKRQEFIHLQRRRIESKKRELSLREERVRTTADPAMNRAYKMKKKRTQRELFALEKDLRAAEEGAHLEPDAGTLPDFVIIGAQKGGTSFLYYLLTQHPLVEPAVRKEVRYFEGLFELGVEWYRWCFAQPKRKDGRRTITGEATPSYLFHAPVAKRMAETVPKARLIALLRNPVDRAYSHYQMQVKRGTEPKTFEEAIKQQRASYLSRGIYVEQLLRWSAFFSKEQMLVLKSEDFFEEPVETLKSVLNFLDLPQWEPDVSQLRESRHEGNYEQSMDSSTRRRLETYFRPYNQRLYEYLGVDFGW
jgi:hypothetical protein